MGPRRAKRTEHIRIYATYFSSEQNIFNIRWTMRRFRTLPVAQLLLSLRHSTARMQIFSFSLRYVPTICNRVKRLTGPFVSKWISMIEFYEKEKFNEIQYFRSIFVLWLNVFYSKIPNIKFPGSETKKSLADKRN